uniref:Uncharacterized protein n=1 Tax=Avena sativa TaxID=4498 RepID=A0ACD5YA74_AVESA
MAEEITRLASIQLASVPEETTSSFAGLTEETGSQASIQLASVPEDTTSSFAGLEAQSYRESIRSVVWPDWRIRSTLSSLSGQSGSNYSSNSGASSSNISGASAGTTDFGADELTKIAHRMVSDGYTQRMVQAFKSNGKQDGSLETWFAELDIEWVFQWREYWQHPCLQEFAERWIRALTIIIVSIKELAADFHDTLAVGRFGEVSISAMFVFIDAVYQFSKVENLHTLLQMYICISNASYDILTMHETSWDDKTCEEISDLLETEGNKLMLSMYRIMRDVKDTLMKDKGRTWDYQREGHWVVDTTDNDDSWAIEIMRGGGEVHKKTRLMVDYIALMRKAHASARSHNTAELRELICYGIDYLKDLLLRKSELCSDPRIRYLFLVNNSYFIEQVYGPSTSLDVELFSAHHPRVTLTPECEKYMDSYLESSWGHVMSCISSSNFPGPLGRWINTSSIAKFQSVFRKTYQAQKFWKVPDPRIRSFLWETIAKRVISGYRDYLKEHPYLEKQVSGGSNSPEVFEEMLGQLFEG